MAADPDAVPRFHWWQAGSTTPGRELRWWVRDVLIAALVGAVLVLGQMLLDDARSNREIAAARLQSVEADQREDLRFVRERSGPGEQERILPQALRRTTPAAAGVPHSQPTRLTELCNASGGGGALHHVVHHEGALHSERLVFTAPAAALGPASARTPKSAAHPFWAAVRWRYEGGSMPGATSPWRVNDVVVYDRMRDAATFLIGQLAATGRSGSVDADAARAELTALRREVSSVDAYDRVAVSALAERIGRRVRQLAGEPR
ncbi:hypothetical protein MRBLWH7_002396 [Microbacterium sp. LWH7-1.2]|uniref:hypothetical protein n=1 Tax=Microbacterium sp. LWH7-1.2 TaxID=3135257 RepID=UPI00313A3AB9